MFIEARRVPMKYIFVKIKILIYICVYIPNLDIGVGTSSLVYHIYRIISEFTTSSNWILTVRKPLGTEATNKLGQSHDLICFALILNTIYDISYILRLATHYKVNSHNMTIVRW